MSFPISPVDGQTTTINGITYVYSAASNSWTRQPTGFVNIDAAGNISAAGNITGQNFYTAGEVSATGNVTGNYFIGNGSQLTGVTASSVDANALTGNTLSSNVIYSSLTTVGTLANLSVTGDINTGGNISATANITGGNIYTVGEVSATANITGGNVLTGNISLTGNVLSSLVVDNYIYANGNVTTGSNLIAQTGYVYAGGNITGGNIFTAGEVSATANVTGGNIFTTGNVSALGNITGGNVYTVGNVSATGNITGGNISTAGNITANYYFGNGSQLTDVIATNIYANALIGNTLSSNVLYSSLTSLGTLSNLSVSGNITAGDANLGNAATANYFIGDGGLLANITGANVTGTVANANFATYAGTAYSVDGGNVSGQVGNALIAGTVYSNDQPNITSVGTLTSLSVSGNIEAQNASFANAAFASGNISLPTQLATKQYVDNAVSTGLQIHESVNVSTTTNLVSTYTPGGTTPTITAITGGSVLTSVGSNLAVNDQVIPSASSNGLIAGKPYFVYSAPNANSFTLTASWQGPQITSFFNGTGLSIPTVANPGIGATLTNAGTQAALVIDSIPLSVTNRVLVQYQANTALNGVYTVSNIGNATTNWVMTRSLDTDQYYPQSQFGIGAGAYFYVQSGNIVGGDSYVVTTPGIIVVGTTGIDFAQFSGAVTYTGVSPVVVIGQTISLANLTGTGDTVVLNNSPTLIAPNIGNAIGNSLSIVGNIQTANYFIGDGYYISNINAANVSSTKISNGNSQANIGTTGGNLDITINSNSVARFYDSGLNVTGAISAVGNVTGNYILGNGYFLTGVITSVANINNGTSNVTVVSADGNITVGVSGVGNVIVFAPTGEYVTGVLSASGNVTGGNLLTGGLVSATGTITAGQFIGNGNTLSNIQGANVSGNVTSAVTAGTVTTNAQPNITSVGTLTSLSVLGNISVGNNSGLGTISSININGQGTGNFAGYSSALTINTVDNDPWSIWMQNQSGPADTGAGFYLDNFGDLVIVIADGAGSYSNSLYIGKNNLSVNVDIFPSANAVYSLGNNNFYWKNLYLSGNITADNVSATGNVVGANILTGGLISATSTITAGQFIGNGNTISNIQGANVSGNVTSAVTAGTVTTNAQPNITSVGTLTSITSSGLISTTGNLVGANILTSGQISATGNITTAAFFVGTFAGSISGNVTAPGANTQVVYNNSGNLAATAGFTFDQASNAMVITGNVTGANFLTGGLISATSTITANGVTSGGIVNFTGASNVSLGDVSNVKITGGQDGQIIVTDGTGNLQWVDNTPTTVTYIANSISQTGGVYVSGDLFSIQVFGDYNDPDGVYILTDGTGAAPAWIFSVGFVSVANFNQVQMNINYTAASNHTIYVQLYNYATSFTLSANTITTTSTGNLVTVNSTANMYVGQTLLFGNSVGGLVAGTNYYVLSVPNSTQVTVGIGTGNSSLVALSNASVTTTVNAQNYDNIGTYTGLGYYYAFALDVIDDTDYINGGVVDLRLFHSNQGNATHTTDIDYVALVLSNQGPQGPKGPTGNTGATGAGVASGGTTGQVLIKNSSANYDTSWSSSLTSLTTISASGNITSGNVLTGGQVSATGNVSGGNLIAITLVQGTTLSATGNVLAGNILTSGLISAVGNITTTGIVNTANIYGVTGVTIATGGNANINLYPGGTGNVVLPSGNATYINNLALYPVQDGDAASKYYVDQVATTGLTYHLPVVAATTANLATTTGGTTSYTQPNGVANGIGAYISTTGSFNLIDTANVQTANTRILVKNEANGAWNGVYGWANSTTIVRTSDTDTYGSTPNTLSLNDYFFVSSGNVNAGSSWVVNAPVGTITFGTSNISFAQFSSSQTYTSGNGIQIDGTIINARVDNVTTAFDLGGNISVKTSANLTTPNIGAATGTSLSVTGALQAGTIVSAIGNIIGGNILTGGFVSAAGSITANANILAGNINTTGQISSTGNAIAGNILTAGLISATSTITAGQFIGNGNTISNIQGANVSGNVTSAVTAGTVTTNAQPNITSVGTLTSITSSGLVSTTGNLVGANILTGGLISATSTITSAADILGANILTTGLMSSTGNVVSGNVLTGGFVSATGNITTAGFFLGTFAGSISGNVTAPGANTQVIYNNNGNLGASTGFTFNQASNAMVVTGNVTGANLLTAGLISATSTITAGQFIGNGNTISNIQGANVSGNVTSAVTAGTVTTNAQPNITSVGTLTSITSSGLISTTGNVVGLNFVAPGSGGSISGSGNITGANLITGGLITATGNIIGGNILTVGLMSSTGNAIHGNILTAGLVSATGNITGNYIIGNGSLLTSITGGNVTGQVGNALIAGTVYTNAQPNITSVGTLTSLSVTGNITSGNLLTGGLISATSTITSAANISGANLLTGGLISATSTITSAANISGANLLTGGQITATGNISTAGYFLGIFAGSISGNVTAPGANTQVVYNNSGNLAGSTGFTFNQASNALVVTGNVTGANITTAGLITATGNITGGNVITAGQVSAVGNVSVGNAAAVTWANATGTRAYTYYNNATSSLDTVFI